MNSKIENLKQKAKYKPLYNMPKDELNSYMNDIFQKYDETSGVPYKYRVRTFKEVYDDLVDIDFDANNERVVTGEKYKEWVKERFRNLTSEEE